MNRKGAASDSIDIDDDAQDIHYPDSLNWNIHQSRPKDALHAVINDFHMVYSNLSAQERNTRTGRLGPSDLATLYDTEWLNDVVIFAFLALVVTYCPKTALLDPQIFMIGVFSIEMGNDGFPYEQWNSMLKEDIWSILVPLNIENRHWVLCAVKWEGNKGTVDTYDSLRSCGGASKKWLIDNLITSLKKIGSQAQSPLGSINEWQQQEQHLGSQGPDSGDCGAFVGANSVKVAFDLPWDGTIVGFRKHMAERLLDAAKGVFSLDRIKWPPSKKETDQPVCTEQTAANEIERQSHLHFRQASDKKRKVMSCSGRVKKYWRGWKKATVRVLAIHNGFDPNNAYGIRAGKGISSDFLDDKKKTGDFQALPGFPNPRVQAEELINAKALLSHGENKYSRIDLEMARDIAHERGLPIRLGGDRNFWIQQICQDDRERLARESLLLITSRWSSSKSSVRSDKY